MTAAVPLPLVSALLELERALGRLAEAVRDPARRTRLWADAARRDAVAGARQDGAAVDPTDVLVATVAPELVPPARRATGLAAHALWRGALLAQGRAPRTTTPPPFALTAPPGPRTSRSAAAAAWQAVAELESPGDVDAHFAADGAPPPPSPEPPAWTVRWLEAVWAATQDGVSGRSDAHFPPHEERQAGALLDRLEGMLRAPGLVGGIEALGHLLRPAPVARVAPWAVPLARLIAPAVLARGARLPEVWIPAAPVLLAERTAARLAAGGSDLEWQVWLAGALADAADAERRRADALEALAAAWRRDSGARRRTSRLPDVLDGLFEHPAFTVRRLQQRLGMTFRGAQLIVDDLVEAGVVREVTQRALDRVYVAVALVP